MSKELWSAVDEYVEGLVIRSDAPLESALTDSRAADLPPINVTPALGKMLHLFARMQGASRILEIGTLGGYSTIWLARALPPGGRLITLEIDAENAAVARRNLARAGLEDVVDLRLAPALETLPKLAAENLPPFDLFFIDANKEDNPEYFQWALKLSRPGSAIIVDNVVRKGEVIEPGSPDTAVQGTRRLMEAVASEPRVSATVVQTVGNKGYDGYLLAIVEK